MKLIDILVEELPQWPQHADVSWQSEETKEIYFLKKGTCWSSGHYYSRYTADVRGEAGAVTREEYLEAKKVNTSEKFKNFLQNQRGAVLYHCPTCDSAYPQEHSARYCCELKTSQIHRCSDCGRNYPNHEAADICCRSTSKTSKVDVKTVLYAAFDLLNSHREMSENEYTIVGSNSLDDIGGLLQDYIEQNEITGFLEL